MAATSLHNDMFFLIPKNVTSERPIALMPTSICWWEALRAPEVAKWQQKYRVEWDATNERNGAAQQSVGNSAGDGKIQWQSKGRRSMSFGLGTGPCEGLRACQPPCALGLGNTLQLPKDDLASALR